MALLRPLLLFAIISTASGFLHGAVFPLASALGRRAVKSRHGFAAGIRMAELEQDDTVVVVGATSRVGDLVAERLLRQGRFKVRLVASNAVRGENIGAAGAEAVFAGSLGQPGASALMDVRRKQRVVDMKMGTGIEMETPGSLVPLRAAFEGAHGVIICNPTTTFPSKRWLLGESPTDVDVNLVENVLGALGPSVKRVVYMSAMGAARDLPVMPKLDANILFWILNRFGAMDTKKQGEKLIRAAATGRSYDYTIVRPKLHCYEAGPFGSPDDELLDSLGYRAVKLVPGDIIDGETSDGDAAEALVQSLSQSGAANREFCVTTARGNPLRGQGVWDALFSSLSDMENQLRAQGIPF
eukprot:CAMPEP_0206214688 /NCGR_PEP_ID=MMETSP0047_2-20121206/1801_1 /ASSEMBLY_ACC=CAM_ASM_000192 /TAXON_ID=195065 /ORGANISM="Chroomonas mesostigmatica_cf, Strain CCMP1168" /LENGTH=354 /DNA_ID=CAMNT_0053636945 /DNA_START=83 /DNA_END=1147 /DNA_ORIENTATION=+